MKFNVIVEDEMNAKYTKEDLCDCGVNVGRIKRSCVSIGGVAEPVFVLECDSDRYVFEDVRDAFGYRQVTTHNGVSLM